MGKIDKTPSSSVFGSRGVLAGLIIIAVIISTAGFIFANSNSGGINVVPPEECGEKTVSYFNSHLAQANSNATLVRVNEKHGMYQIVVNYQGQDSYFYTSKDCIMMFNRFYNMTASTNTTPAPTNTIRPATPTPTPTPVSVKSARPSVELFVMSFCPYGVQAEKAMEPVVGLLGTKANFTIRYIATVNGTTVNDVKSLHGITEAKEDLRQLCIATYYPDKLWPYLIEFDKNCYPSSIRQNETALDACEINTTQKIGIDNQKIETCAGGSEGLELLKADEAITKSLKITGSPTLLINGQKYSGQRSPEAFKQAICARFETPPAECSTNLSAEPIAVS